MQSLRAGSHASAVWLETLWQILVRGNKVTPRGMPTKELLHHTVRVNMSRPVVLCPERKLSYTFLAAEALWILSGDDRIDGIAPYNKNIAQFSDDGVTFFGAYGPKIKAQLGYIVGKLLEDRDTRQAVLTIWRENPPATKDVPCTVAMGFSIRDDRLHCHVFMRSSDAWLGLPYDVFNFSMVAARVACAYNAMAIAAGRQVELGWLNLTMASSHLYERDWEGAERCLQADEAPLGITVPIPSIVRADWSAIDVSLMACRDKCEATFPELPWRIRP